jgi:hypothetical protein
MDHTWGSRSVSALQEHGVSGLSSACGPLLFARCDVGRGAGDGTGDGIGDLVRQLFTCPGRLKQRSREAPAASHFTRSKPHICD